MLCYTFNLYDIKRKRMKSMQQNTFSVLHLSFAFKGFFSSTTSSSYSTCFWNKLNIEVKTRQLTLFWIRKYPMLSLYRIKSSSLVLGWRASNEIRQRKKKWWDWRSSTNTCTLSFQRKATECQSTKTWDSSSSILMIDLAEAWRVWNRMN